MKVDIPPGAVLLGETPTPPPAMVTEEITCMGHSPGVSIETRADGSTHVFLSFDVVTGMGAMKRYRFPFNWDTVSGYTDFVLEQVEAFQNARADADAEAETAV